VCLYLSIPFIGFARNSSCISLSLSPSACFQFHLLDSQSLLRLWLSIRRWVLSIPFIGFLDMIRLSASFLSFSNFQFHLLDSRYVNGYLIDEETGLSIPFIGFFTSSIFSQSTITLGSFFQFHLLDSLRTTRTYTASWYHSSFNSIYWILDRERLRQLIESEQLSIPFIGFATVAESHRQEGLLDLSIPFIGF